MQVGLLPLQTDYTETRILTLSFLWPALGSNSEGIYSHSDFSLRPASSAGSPQTPDGSLSPQSDR